MSERVFKDTRLLEALEFIDDEYIASAARYRMKYEAQPAEPPKMTWRTPLKHWRQFVALAACILLLSVASPLVSYIAQVISNFNAGAGSGTTEFMESLDSELTKSTDEATSSNTNLDTSVVTEIEEEPLQWWNPGPWYLEYEGIEPLTEEQMLEYRKEYAEEWYDHAYEREYKKHIENNSEEVAKELATKVAQSAYDRNFPKLFNEKYYTYIFYIGVVNNCVLFFNGETTNIWKEQLGDKEFVHGYYYVLKDGEFYHLSTAYKNGWLTDDDILVVWNKLELFVAAQKAWIADVNRRVKENIEFKGE